MINDYHNTLAHSSFFFPLSSKKENSFSFFFLSQSPKNLTLFISLSSRFQFCFFHRKKKLKNRYAEEKLKNKNKNKKEKKHSLPNTTLKNQSKTRPYNRKEIKNRRKKFLGPLQCLKFSNRKK